MDGKELFEEITDFPESLNNVINNYKPARLPEESYEEYKMRRTIRKIAEKRYLQRGVVFWDTKLKGTYINGARS